MANAVKTYMRGVPVQDREVMPIVLNQDTRVNGQPAKLFVYEVKRGNLTCYANASHKVQTCKDNDFKKVSSSTDSVHKDYKPKIEGAFNGKTLGDISKIITDRKEGILWRNAFINEFFFKRA